jgi:hypothetical protein
MLTMLSSLRLRALVLLMASGFVMAQTALAYARCDHANAPHRLEATQTPCHEEAAHRHAPAAPEKHPAAECCAEMVCVKCLQITPPVADGPTLQRARFAEMLFIAREEVIFSRLPDTPERPPKRV